MDLESRIHDLLVEEDAGRRDPIDSYESIVTRGKRRRIQTYVTQAIAVAAVLGLVVVGTSLLSGGRTTSDPVAPSTESDVIDLGGGLLGTVGEVGPAPLEDRRGWRFRCYQWPTPALVTWPG